MTINGHIENGKIVLDEAVPLAEGIKVRIELLSESVEAEKSLTEADASLPTFYERNKTWIGMVKDAPSDYARNHDHYLHGQPKK